MLTPAIVALAFGIFFALLLAARRSPGAAFAAVIWLLYALYEWLMYLRVLCSGECNIRIDLLVIWPFLLCASLAVPVRIIIRKFKLRDRK